MRFCSTYLSLIFTLLFIHFSHSQVNSSTEKKTSLSSVESQLVELDTLVSKHLKARDIDNFIKYTEAYVDLALQHKKYEQAARKAMALTYPVSNYPAKQTETVRIIDKVLVYKDQLENSYLTGGLYLKRGGANYQINLIHAIEDYSEAINNYQSKDTLFLADAYLYRAQSYSYTGKYVEAGNDYRKAYDLYEMAGDLQYMIHARNGEIIMYSENGLLDMAIAERNKLIEFVFKNNHLESLSSFYYNNSLDYNKKNNQKLREEALLSALKYSEYAKQNDAINLFSHAALAEIYINRGDLQKSVAEMEKAYKVFERNIENNYLEMNYLGPNIRILIYQKKFDEAEEKALRRLEIAKQLQYKSEIFKTYQYLSEIYEGQKKYDKSIAHHKEYVRLKDSVFVEDNIKSLLFYQTLYETERKEKELIEKSGSIALLKEKNANLNRQYILGGSLLTLAFVLLFLYKNHKNLKAKKEMQEKYTQDLLEAQEEERKRMSKDLHDGLGQSLLLIKNKVVLNRDESTKNLIENAIEEVRAISRALHPYQLQELGITQAIKNTLQQLDETSEIFVSCEIENIDGVFSPDGEIHLFRMLQECLNNIIKHSNATALKVDITNENSSVKMVLKDNGVGFDFSEKYHDFKSLGLKTLKERTRYLNGIMKVASELNKGTTMEFIIPKNNG